MNAAVPAAAAATAAAAAVGPGAQALPSALPNPTTPCHRPLSWLPCRTLVPSSYSHSRIVTAWPTTCTCRTREERRQVHKEAQTCIGKQLWVRRMRGRPAAGGASGPPTGRRAAPHTRGGTAQKAGTRGRQVPPASSPEGASTSKEGGAPPLPGPPGKRRQANERARRPKETGRHTTEGRTAQPAQQREDSTTEGRQHNRRPEETPRQRPTSPEGASMLKRVVRPIWKRVPLKLLPRGREGGQAKGREDGQD